MALKDLWAPVMNWVDPEVGLRVKKIWDCRVLFKSKVGIDLPSY
jgi:hypothetical protein